jgi:hypothetical protein
MLPIRVIAIPTGVVETVRGTHQSPRYKHPVHIEVAAGYGPCRHCLQAFRKGLEQRTLFTYDAFDGVDPLPLPGPVFIHTDGCARYPEDGGYPEGLRQYGSVLDAYGAGRRLIAEVLIDDGSQPSAIQELLQRPGVEYVHVRDKNAGCYDFRVERAGSSVCWQSEQIPGPA